MRVYSPQSRRGRRVRYFFSFPLRGRKAKTLDPVGNDNILFSGRKFARFCFLAIQLRVLFLCRPLNGKGKI